MNLNSLIEKEHLNRCMFNFFSITLGIVLLLTSVISGLNEAPTYILIVLMYFLIAFLYGNYVLILHIRTAGKKHLYKWFFGGKVISIIAITPFILSFLTISLYITYVLCGGRGPGVM